MSSTGQLWEETAKWHWCSMIDFKTFWHWFYILYLDFGYSFPCSVSMLSVVFLYTDSRQVCVGYKHPFFHKQFVHLSMCWFVRAGVRLVKSSKPAKPKLKCLNSAQTSESKTIEIFCHANFLASKIHDVTYYSIISNH